MFNREYHRRAARQALEGIGAALAPDNSGFYRPVKRTRPGAAVKARMLQKRASASGYMQGVQLELFADKMSDSTNPDQPLSDLFPEAYA